MEPMKNQPAPVLVRPMEEADLDAADRIARVAFGTFLGMPEPEAFFGDADFVRSRWRADPTGGLVAEIDGVVVGSNLAARWGSVGFFGPLTVDPPHWDRAVGRRLMDSTMEIFAGWQTRHVGLFTFAHSAKHVGLYQRYGFWPRFLTAIMSAPVPSTAPRVGTLLSELSEAERTVATDKIAQLTDAVYPGLDLTLEMESVAAQSLGDTVLVEDGATPTGMAVCHVGPGSEAGGGNCYVKFAAVRPGARAPEHFASLVEACQGFAGRQGASTLVAGMSAERERAWVALEAMGFRRDMQGVTMHRPNEGGYNSVDSFVIDDWR